jgi:hypothetical protein
MMRKLLLLVIMVLPALCFGQAEITVGKPYQVVDAAEKYYFKNEDQILTVKVDGSTVILQKFSSSDLSFKTVKEYKGVLKDFSLEKVTKFQDKYYIFFSDYDKANEKEQLYCREIDFEACALKSQTKILTTSRKVTGSPLGSVGYYWSFGVTDKYQFYFSFDSVKMLVQYRLRPEEKKDAKSWDIIGMGVYNKAMDLQWNQEVKMPYTEKKMNNIDYSVDQAGNVYILTTVYNDNTTDEKKSRDGNANYHIELLKVKANTTKVDITPIKLTDKFINRLWIYETSKDEMICAGFYNKGKDLADADGILIFNIEKDGTLTDIKTYEIPLAILNQNVSRRTQKKNEKKEEGDDAAEFQELELREVLVDKDGSLLLIGEQYFMRQHTRYSSNGMSTTYYTYHYNDMLITKIAPSGALAWMKKLPKQQIGRNGRGGMSYSYIDGKSHHYFIFLDNEKNKDLTINEVPTRHSDGAGGFLTAYKIDDITGQTKKEYILDTRDVRGIELYQFRTSRIIPVSSNEFVFESYKKKKEDVMIKVGL